MDVLYLSDQEVDQALIGLVVADCDGVAGSGEKADDEEDAVADAGRFHPELLLLLDLQVLLVQTYAVLENPHVLVHYHVLDRLLIHPRYVGLDERYLVTIHLLNLHIHILDSLADSGEVDLRQFDHEGVRYNFAQHQLVVAIDEQKGEKMDDACYLAGICSVGVVYLSEEFVQSHFGALKGVVGFELLLDWEAKNVVQQEFQLPVELGIVWGFGTLRGERGDCVRDVIFDLCKFAKHVSGDWVLSGEGNQYKNYQVDP